MFSILACKVKQNAPRCHIYLEIIYTRYGALTHWVFIFFALLTNVLLGSQLLLGRSTVVTSLTRINIYAAILLTPLGVCVYVVLGGLRAAFLCTLVNLHILYFYLPHPTRSLRLRSSRGIESCFSLYAPQPPHIRRIVLI